MTTLRLFLGSMLLTVASLLCGCGDPPDDTPLGRDVAAVLARREQAVEQVTVQHVLVAFVGATRGSESNRSYEEARTLAEELLKRARSGEDFPAMMDRYSTDEGGGTYSMTQKSRHGYAKSFHKVAFRLAVGEVGVAAYDPSKCPFGFHVIKRIE